jgi:5-methylcytosine-specific restriction endonuclease McrA
MKKYDYFKYLKSSSWKERRKELLEEAEYICDVCGGKATQIHHLDYKNLGGEMLNVDVIAVCNKCHQEIHGEPKTYGTYKGYGEGDYGECY